MIIQGQIVDVFNRTTFPGEVHVENGRIQKIVKTDSAPQQYIMPGFVDSHVHIESSMLSPARFAEMAVKHGTLATVSDPHEISNVMGVEGLNFMIENSKTVPLQFFFGAPSCVPATAFETSGANIDAAQIAELMQRDDVWYLGEMMNFPGVVFDDPEVHAKINASLAAGKPVDGHAPLLAGDDLRKYAAAGITTDHECTNIEEARAKIDLGMKVLIREGSAARDFDALWPLIDSNPNEVMLCTDDCHPDELQERHINLLATKALENGADIYNVLMASAVNPVQHYKLPLGLMREGDSADFIVVEDLKNFGLIESYMKGERIFANGQAAFKAESSAHPNRFERGKITSEAIALKAEKSKIKLIEAGDGDLLTRSSIADIKIENVMAVSDPEHDILKIVVASRYDNNPPSIGFIRGFNLKQGALACSIAHDSHNLIAVGVSDEDITRALNLVVESKGGLAAVSENEQVHLPLEIAGLMADAPGEQVAASYKVLNDFAAKNGSKLKAPYMTMAFMALLVIPELKLGDKGLFDGLKFEFTSLFID
ncbi:MAG: adenine deaminase [Marinilabiliales bacterium]|nr:MAG: adenine deaminase [Marinilabiliales bacterium]